MFILSWVEGPSIADSTDSWSAHETLDDGLLVYRQLLERPDVATAVLSVSIESTDYD
jgi:hypothetical protein